MTQQLPPTCEGCHKWARSTEPTILGQEILALCGRCERDAVAVIFPTQPMRMGEGFETHTLSPWATLLNVWHQLFGPEFIHKVVVH